MIIVLVNSLVILQEYAKRTADDAIEKIRIETPIHVKAFCLPNGSIGIYNGEPHRIYIKYVVLSNSTIIRENIIVDPFKYAYISNNSDILAFITDDSHIISIEGEESQQSYKNECLYLKRKTTGLVGDGYLSRLYEYTVIPGLNGFGVKKKVMFTYSRFLKADLDKINKGYRLLISPLYSKKHVKRYIVTGGQGTVYVNLTDGSTRTEKTRYSSFKINISSELFDTKSVYLMPVDNRIVLDDEKAVITYNINYHANLRRLYLYINGSLIHIVRNNSWYSIGSVFHVVLNKTLKREVYISINSTNLNYSTVIQYKHGTTIELRSYSELKRIDVSAIIELHPSVIVLPPKELSEYTININGSKEVYAVFENPFTYYTLKLYPKNITPFEKFSLRTKGVGTVFYSTKFKGNVILLYSYSDNYTMDITLGTLISVITLYKIGDYRILSYFIIPVLSEELYIIEIYEEPYKSLFHIKTYSNSPKYSFSYTSWKAQEIYVHYPFNELQMYNYIPLTGNALINYPTKVGENSSMLIHGRRFNITRDERLNLNQYDAFNGSVKQVKLCLNSSLSGYLDIVGVPGTVFYLIKPIAVNIEPNNETYISQNYIVSKIPSKGELLIPFTLLSGISP